MEVDIIVVGAGLVGASFAVALRDSGLKLAVIEAQEPPGASRDGWDSRVYAVNPGAASFLDAIGIWRELDHARIAPVSEMAIFGDDGKAKLEFSAYEYGVAELCCIVEAGALAGALWQRLAEQDNVELICPARCAELDLDAEQADLLLEDGRRICGKLVVGADGADSWVRERARIRLTAMPYRQTAVVANFAAGQSHHDVARQWFRTDGVLALLPLPQQRVSMVWSTWDEHAAELLALGDDEFAACVCAASRACVGALCVITPARGFALRLQKVDRLIAQRIALIGDAAHNVHPLAGQGVNLGFQDARELAAVVIQRGAQSDCGDYRLLRRYERARRERILAMQLTTHALQRLFSANGNAIAWLRNTGLALTNQLSPLKSMLVGRALN